MCQEAKGGSWNRKEIIIIIIIIIKSRNLSKEERSTDRAEIWVHTRDYLIFYAFCKSHFMIEIKKI